MPNDEPPITPDLQTDFHTSTDNQHQMNESQSKVVTAQEQQMLEEQRAALRLEQHYTIDGSIEQDANTQIAANLEERINYIAQRRAEAQRKFRENFRNSSRR